MSRSRVAEAYDAWADEYIEKLGSVDKMAPADRATIDQWGGSCRDPILDAGCGPGHWSDVLSERGEREVVGVDGSARFLDSARQRFPHVTFAMADLAALPVASGSLGGILSWYSIIHTDPSRVPAILSEFARVLSPGGSLLLGFFDGEARAPFDHTVTTAYYWSADALGELLASHEFVVEHAATRQDPDVRRHGELIATLTA